jgi:hypothetical protein
MRFFQAFVPFRQAGFTNDAERFAILERKGNVDDGMEETRPEF